MSVLLKDSSALTLGSDRNPEPPWDVDDGQLARRTHWLSDSFVSHCTAHHEGILPHSSAESLVTICISWT